MLNSLTRPYVENLEVCPPDESGLVAAAAPAERDTQRQREARRELFERFREEAYRVAVRITGRQEDALDVVQDGFIRAFERLDAFSGQSSFKTWLLRIVTNRALDLLRTRKVRLAIALHATDDENPVPELAARQDEGEPGREIEQRELAERLRRALDTLPAEQRVVFALHATGELTYGEIAEVVGIPVGTVMSRLYHARRRLHESLADLAPR